jgi:riboflavin transport system substrate-binding protein
MSLEKAESERESVMKRFTRVCVAAALGLAILVSSCGGSKPSSAASVASGKSAFHSVAVYVPGIMSGSPIYTMLAEGAKKAVEAVPGTSIRVVEAGNNQAEWLDKLTSLAASGEFDLIVTSNPSLPELCAKVAQSYPKIKFLVADAYLAGNPAIHTVLYNQLEQGYIVGYLAGLITTSKLPGANPDKKVGMIIAQTYPTMDKLIRPGFEAGLKAVDPSITLDVRVVGNWYDANRGAELASSLIDSGVDVILPIAGGAGQGVLSVSKERGTYAVWFEGAGGYAMAPGTVLGCAVLDQGRLVREKVTAILSGDASLFGKADVVGVAGGYIGFDKEGEAYKALPEELRTKFEVALESLRKGSPSFPVSAF